jgi:hypothetical protein
MAEITNSEAIAFCNSRVRTAADRLANLYYVAKSVSQEWTATGLGDIIVYNNEDLVVDGSAQDGRHPISGVDVNNLITRLNEFVTDMEANSNAKLNTVLAVAVNVRG